MSAVSHRSRLTQLSQVEDQLLRRLLLRQPLQSHLQHQLQRQHQPLVRLTTALLLALTTRRVMTLSTSMAPLWDRSAQRNVAVVAQVTPQVALQALLASWRMKTPASSIAVSSVASLVVTAQVAPRAVTRSMVSASGHPWD